MDRRDVNYYRRPIDLEQITSDHHNATVLQRLRDNDPTLKRLRVQNQNYYLDGCVSFVIREGDDLGWLGYFLGKSEILEALNMSEEAIDVNRIGIFIEGLKQNQSIHELRIAMDFGSEGFRQMSHFFSNNNRLRQLIFYNFDTMGVDSARSIAYMLSQSEQSNLWKINMCESNASEQVLAEIAKAVRYHSQLEDLDLRWNNLGREGSLALGNALAACTHPSLESLLLRENAVDDVGLQALVAGLRTCHNLTWLDLGGNELITVDGCSSLSTLFQSVNCCLLSLDLDEMNIGDDGARAIATGLASLNWLETLSLSHNSIGDEGARAIAAGLMELQSMKKLWLSHNFIGDDGISALAPALASFQSLERLDLPNNSIGDVGLQALVEGISNCSDLSWLRLGGNQSITALGLRSLATWLLSQSCSLTQLHLSEISFCDDMAVVLADGLKGNKTLNYLYFDADSPVLTSAGWSTFSKLLCDTSSINNTYLSNHTLETAGVSRHTRSYESTPRDVKQVLELNRQHTDEHVAIQKMLKSHSDFDVGSMLQWKLKLLPFVVPWFDRVSAFVAEDDEWMPGESVGAIQSRKLSTMYKFVHGMPLLVVGCYRSYIHAALLAPIPRKRKIDQLSGNGLPRRIEYV